MSYDLDDLLERADNYRRALKENPPEPQTTASLVPASSASDESTLVPPPSFSLDQSHGVWWNLIDREHHLDAAVGPYLTQELAETAMADAMQIDFICEEDCLGAETVALHPAQLQHILDTYDCHTVVANH